MRKLCMLAALLFAASGTWAAYTIPLVNPSFEQPNTGFVAPFDPNVPGWHDVVATVLDSNVQTGGWGQSDGSYTANVQQEDYDGGVGLGTNDHGAYQLTSHTIGAADQFVLSFDAQDIWGAAMASVELFWDTPDVPANVITNFTTTTLAGWYNNTWVSYSITSSVPAGAVGHTLGVRFHNIGTDGGNSWIAFDNFSLMNLATAPFIVTATTPGDGDTGVTNDVVVSSTFIDDASTLNNATVYLDGYSTIIGSSVNSTGGTNVLSTSVDPQTFDPNSEHTVHIVMDGTPQSLTNTVTFTMDDQFNITVTPADGTYSIAEDYMPVITATIIDRTDAISFPTLYINGGYVATSDSLGTTSTVEYAFTSPIAAGSNITCQLIVTGVDYGDQTNDWSFTMGGDVGITIWGTNPPTADTYDQWMTNSSATEAVNLGTDDNLTYVAGDRPAQGQFFTTPAGTAFEVDSVWIQDVPYSTPNSLNPGDQLIVRITDPAQSNDVNFVRYRSTTNMVVINDSLADADGRWIQLKLEEPVVLSPSKKYGFDVKSFGPWFEISALAAGGYANGDAYSSGGAWYEDNTATVRTGDRSFLVSLNPSTAPFIFASESPKGADAPNPVVLSSTFDALNDTYVSAELFLNGGSVGGSVSGTGPYTITANVGTQPLNSTNTAMVVVTGASETVSNTWDFVVAGGFQLSGQVPAVNAFLFTNDTPVSVDVVNLGDTLNTATMYLDAFTNEIASAAGGSTTTTVSAASSGILDPGNHTVFVITDGASSGLMTNWWDFGVAGGSGIYMSGTTAPATNADDIAQFLVSGGNVNGDASDHESNYIANNRPCQGQMFTTTNGTGFTLSSVWVKLSDFATGGGKFVVGDNKTLRITDPDLTNTPFFAVYQETLTLKNTVGSGYDPDINNQWLEFKLENPIVLKANKQYGFDISTATADAWFQLAGISTDPYAGGSAYNTGTNGVPANEYFTTNTPGDRAFMVELEGGATYVPFNPFSISYTPVGVTGTNDVTVSATIVDFEETLSTAALYIDGALASSSPSGSGGTNTISSSATYAPLSSHTAMLITTGAEYPSYVITNTWSFAIGEQAAPGTVISWNWEHFGGVALADLAGIVSVSNWNDSTSDGYGYNASKTQPWLDLRDDLGSNTTVDVTWSFNTNANNLGWHIQDSYWPDLDSDGTANKRMINGYMDAYQDVSGLSNSVVTLSEIAYPSYDIIVYFSSDNADREGSVSDGSSTYYFKTLGPASIASGNALFQRATDTTTNGYNTAANYAVFSGLSGSSQTITVAPVDIPFNGMGIAGFQIIGSAGGGPVATTIGVAVSGGNIVISWPAVDGAGNVYTNSDLVNGLWGLYGAGSVNGTNYEVNIPMTEQQLFIKAE